MSDKKKVIIVSDTTCDLSEELISKYDIKILPLYVNFSDGTYKDKFEINPDDIYDRYSKTKELPKTSAASIQDHIDMMSKYSDECEGVIYFNISSKLSCSFNNARLAAEEFDNVYVIDSLNLSTGIGLQVIHAAELAEHGLSAAEIKTEIENVQKRVDASFVVDTLEYLAKGGRCSSVAALGANLLKLHPCIVVRDGAMSVTKKYRGGMISVLNQYANDVLSDIDNIEDEHIFITHSGCPDEWTDEMYNLLKSMNKFKNIYITRAGCTISSHCGAGTLGILFIRKTEL